MTAGRRIAGVILAAVLSCRSVNRDTSIAFAASLLFNKKTFVVVAGGDASLFPNFDMVWLFTKPVIFARCLCCTSCKRAVRLKRCGKRSVKALKQNCQGNADLPGVSAERFHLSGTKVGKVD